MTQTLAKTRHILVALLAPSTALVACGSAATTAADAGPDTGSDAGPHCQSFSPSSKESDIAAAIATTKDGACIEFAAGTYKLRNQLAFGSGNNVTMSGAGIGKTVFDFSGLIGGDDGIFAQSVQNLTLKGFSVQDAPGNAIKTLGVTGVTFDTVGVDWTNADGTKHGAYGLYPVSCKNVLIQNSQVSGANDAGIYVGQSQHIVVRNSQAFHNVAGIEIENSYFADVYGNTAHDNTAGILVFSLPGLPQEGCHTVRLYDNTIENNNSENFGATGSIVSIVPGGTGSFVMAADHVEIFGNTYTGNKTGAFGILNYADSQLPITDKKYVPYPSDVYLHDNVFKGNGTMPDFNSQFGMLLVSALFAFPGMHVSDVLYDGILPSGATGADPEHICVQENLCNLHLDKFDVSAPNLPSIMTCYPPTSPSPFDCTLPKLTPVTFPGLTK